jgi:HD-GYP domain-containing protein (c-di-GMP phosphodiesterase class II)
MAERGLSGVRLAELVASLSLATDLGLGQPQEHVLRQTVIATRLAASADLSDDAIAAAFFVSLLALVGCVADSHELGRWFSDDTRIRAASYQVDRAGLPMLRFLVSHLAAGGSSLQRISAVGRFLAGGVGEVMDSMAAHCQTTADIADRLGLSGEVQRALPQALERWDGKGGPRGLAGDQIEPVMRVVQIANEAEVFHRLGGISAATAMLRERRAREFDPNLVDRFVADADDILGDLDTVDAWGIAIDGCAPLDRRLTEAEFRGALATFADYADLKSPWFTGHSRAVAALAAEAAGRAGLSPAEVELVELAGFVCRLGTIGVSSATWDRAGPLAQMEWERVRTVPYLTERVLGRQPRLADIGTIAGMVHERLDGSGYPRGVSGGLIPAAARVLAAAEVYQALREARPYREARSAQDAEAHFLAEAHAGRLDSSAVNAVLIAAGHRTRRRPTMVAGLSAREMEVLELLVRGRSNKDIAAALWITPKTVGSHIEHIYTKIGVNTRGAAAMYAMRHGLVDLVEQVDASQHPVETH